jgi:quercetin 2,3-dioxygenase
MKIRRSVERGHFNHDWLDTYHTFSFGDYDDPRYREFSVLRVINEDRILPGEGFGMHGHANMEIVTYIIEGSLKHADSLGHTSILREGEVQRITAGKGIRHGEWNASDKDIVHLLQIWIYPEEENLPPSYEQEPVDLTPNRLCPIVTRKGGKKILRIHQDVTIYSLHLDNHELVYPNSKGRAVWIQVIEGPVTCNSARLENGDGASFQEETSIALKGEKAHLLLFDLPLIP